MSDHWCYAREVRLADALAAMSPDAFERLLARRGVTIDPAKKLAPVEQASRLLATLSPERLAALPSSVHDVIRALTPSPGRAPRASLGAGVLSLIELGLAFPVAGDPSVIAMPSAYRLQMASPAGEDPRSARALLATLDAETYKTIALQRLGRPPVAPRPLVLGDVLDALEASADLAPTLTALPRPQLRALAAIEARGSTASGEEVLDLAREPARWGPAHALPKQGAAHALVARAFLLPHGPGAYALPSEVAQVVGRERRALALRVRDDVARRIALSDDDPARAKLAEDPGPIAIALLAELAARGALPDGASPIRRSELRAAARTFGVEPERAELLVAVARAARLEAIPLALARARMFATWRASGAWDEARIEADRLRVAEPAASLPTPTAALREALLDVLVALPEGRFAPADVVLRAARADLRCDAAPSLLARAGRRVSGALLTDPEAILRALLERSLPALGAIDLARDERGATRVRLSSAARNALSGGTARVRPPPAEPPLRWQGGGRFAIGPAVEVGRVLAFAAIVRAIPRDDRLVFALDPERIAELAGRGELEAHRDALVSLAPLDADTARMLAVEPRSVVACELVTVSAYVVIEDDAFRAVVAADPALADSIARVLPDGVLVREGVSVASVQRRIRKLGGTF